MGRSETDQVPGRRGTIPTIQFFAKGNNYGLYSHQTDEHFITIVASGDNYAAVKKSFKITFSIVQGIPIFKTEPMPA